VIGSRSGTQSYPCIFRSHLAIIITTSNSPSTYSGSNTVPQPQLFWQAGYALLRDPFFRDAFLRRYHAVSVNQALPDLAISVEIKRHYYRERSLLDILFHRMSVIATSLRQPWTECDCTVPGNQNLRRCWLPRDLHVALHRLCQLGIDLIRDSHNIRQQQTEVQGSQILLQRPKECYLEYS
jgi:hypothetical protein